MEGSRLRGVHSPGISSPGLNRAGLEDFMNPRAKTHLLIEELPEETLVYDLDEHRAHCLNPTAAFLLRHADGTRGEAELARLASEAYGEPTTEEIVQVGLERLARSGLVEWHGQSPAASGPSRRDVLRKLATVGLAIPAVMTILSPTAASAGTGISPSACRTLQDVGGCCTNDKYCIQTKKGVECKGARC